MPAPQKKGLKYFPFDVGFYRDKKIKLLRGEHGSDGVELYIMLLCKAYEENGYYLNWDINEDYELLAEESGYSIEKVRLIMSTLFRRSLFDYTLFERGNVLSSSGIQRRYFEVAKATKIKAAAAGRHTTIEKDICLLTEEDFSELNTTYTWLCITEKNSNSENNYNKSENNDSKSENNSTNKTKEKEIKEKETILSSQISEVIEYLNLKTDKKFNTNKKHEFISGRLNDGRTIDELKYVIDVKCEEWLHNAEFNKNLNPETLFRPGNFERYINQKMKNQVNPGKHSFDIDDIFAKKVRKNF